MSAFIRRYVCLNTFLSPGISYVRVMACIWTICIKLKSREQGVRVYSTILHPSQSPSGCLSVNLKRKSIVCFDRHWNPFPVSVICWVNPFELTIYCVSASWICWSISMWQEAWAPHVCRTHCQTNWLRPKVTEQKGAQHEHTHTYTCTHTAACVGGYYLYSLLSLFKHEPAAVLRDGAVNEGLLAKQTNRNGQTGEEWRRERERENGRASKKGIVRCPWIILEFSVSCPLLISASSTPGLSASLQCFLFLLLFPPSCFLCYFPRLLVFLCFCPSSPLLLVFSFSCICFLFLFPLLSLFAFM